jgi:hypothetical protein
MNAPLLPPRVAHDLAVEALPLLAAIEHDTGVEEN